MDLKLDNNGDLAIESGDFVLLDGVDAIAQDCDVRLNFSQGEWFLDQRLGVPYFQKILGQKPRISAVTQIIQDAILTTPGILSISDFRIDYNGTTRLLSIEFVGVADSGTFEYSKELIVK
jgi:hypothetical protein